MDLGRVGIWTWALDMQPSSRAGELAAELEGLGYGAVWLPETANRDPFVHATLLLGATQRMAVATGIASIWARDPVACSSAQKTVAEAFPGRFLLGLGVSHQPLVEGVRGHHYDKPYSAMVAYLDGLDRAPFFATAPAVEPQRVLAALGPRMLRLAAERAAGAHPYLVPVEHTSFARDTLGPEPMLCVEQMVVLDTDRERALETARTHVSTYLSLPNYTNNLRRFGFGDDDFAEGGNERLLDALVAMGDEETAAARVRAHLDAGATHVCVQALLPRRADLPLAEWRRLAPALTRL